MFEDLITELQGPANELVAAAGDAGLLPRVTSTVRTRSQQTRLYQRYLAGLSPYPAAPPGTSAHEFGYAFDMVVSPEEALADVGYTWQQWGGIWGGKRDPVHFEFPGFVAPLSDPRDPFLAPIQKAAEVSQELPWWASWATPWQISAYAAAPAWIRNLLIVPRPYEEFKAVMDLLEKVMG